MKINISKQHLNKFPKLSDYAVKKVRKLDKYNAKILSVTIHLIDNEAHRGKETDFTCELEINLPGRDLTIKDTERAMDKAVDRVVERAKRLIVKSKEKKITKKHREGVSSKNKD